MLSPSSVSLDDGGMRGITWFNVCTHVRTKCMKWSKRSRLCRIISTSIIRNTSIPDRNSWNHRFLLIDSALITTSHRRVTRSLSDSHRYRVKSLTDHWIFTKCHWLLRNRLRSNSVLYYGWEYAKLTHFHPFLLNRDNWSKGVET